MARSRWERGDYPFELRTSEIQGRGAFATEPIRKGTRIIEYTGERIDQKEADRRYDDASMKRHHTFLFSLDNGQVIDAAVGGNEARFLNHSCDPNCEAVEADDRIFIEAKRAIAEGEELVYDYQYERTDEHDDEDEKMYACRCGAPNCRGSILAPRKEPKRAAAGVKKRASGSKKRSGSKRKSGSKQKAGSRTKSGVKSKLGSKSKAKSKPKGKTKTTSKGRARR